jgi:hypothetical protein
MTFAREGADAPSAQRSEAQRSYGGAAGQAMHEGFPIRRNAALHRRKTQRG